MTYVWAGLLIAAVAVFAVLMFKVAKQMTLNDVIPGAGISVMESSRGFLNERGYFDNVPDVVAFLLRVQEKVPADYEGEIEVSIDAESNDALDSVKAEVFRALAERPNLKRMVYLSLDDVYDDHKFRISVRVNPKDKYQRYTVRDKKISDSGTALSLSNSGERTRRTEEISNPESM